MLRSGVASTVRVDTGGGVARATLVRGIIHLLDRKSTRLNSSHSGESRMPSSACDAEALPDSARRRDLISPMSRKRCRIFIDMFPSSSAYSFTLRSGVASTVCVDTGGGIARATLVRGIIHLLAIRRV